MRHVHTSQSVPNSGDYSFTVRGIVTGPMTTHTQTSADFTRLLNEQMEFLRASAAAFDQGHTGEAKRLAVSIRVLLHDTAASRSLLTHLGVKDNLTFMDTSAPIHPANLLSTVGLAMVGIQGDGTSFYAAPLADLSPPRASNPPKPFVPWWTDPVTKVMPGGETFARKKFVLDVANKEGGAHVDHQLDARWAALTRDNALGYQSAHVPEGVKAGEEAWQDITGGPELASVRQIAYEVEQTILGQLAHLLK